VQAQGSTAAFANVEFRLVPRKRLRMVSVVIRIVVARGRREMVMQGAKKVSQVRITPTLIIANMSE
jgi:hypothetical protein